MATDAEAREPSDAELLRAVAGGDEAAYGVLWTRHEAAARRLAAQLTRPSNVDDLVSEAFLRVLRAIKDGGGPDSAFRPYLFNTMRRFNIDTGRSYFQRVTLTEDDRELDVLHAESAGDVYSSDAEQQAAWRAWESLPDDSRLLLWHLVVEEETPAQIAPLLGVSPNGVSSRAVRAKERLRQAFLSQHLAHSTSEDCKRTRRDLGAYVRNALSNRDRKAVDEHLQDCRHCTAALAELRDVNMTLKLVIAPLLLGGTGIAAAYLSSGGAAAGPDTTAAARSLPLRALDRVATRRHLVAAVVTAAACAIAAVAYAATSGSPKRQPVALPNPPVVSTAPSSPPATSPDPSSSAPTSRPVSSATRPAPPASTPTSHAAGLPPADPTSSRPGATSPHRSPTPSAPRTSTGSRPSSGTSSSTPAPALVQRQVTLALPSGQSGGAVTTALPSGWRVVTAAVDGTPVLVPSPGTGRLAWTVVGSALALVVEGPAAAPAALDATMRTASGTTATTVPLVS